MKNVRCVPQFGCTLVSVDQLFEETRTRTHFNDVRQIAPARGPAIPFIRKDGLYILEAAGIRHSLAAPGDSSKSKSTVRALLTRPHSAHASSFLANLPPDQAAELLHRRLHIGAERIRRLPRYSADIPENVASAVPSTCAHCVEANATRLGSRERAGPSESSNGPTPSAILSLPKCSLFNSFFREGERL